MRTYNLPSKQPLSSKAPLAAFITPTCKSLAMEDKSPSHGMDFQSETNIPTPYVSAPSSPAKCDNFSCTPCFQSLPVSSAASFSILSPELEAMQDDFEFEKSTRTESSSCKEEQQQIQMQQEQQQQQQQQQQKRHVSSMPFADELFSNGQLRPLKLPPRLQGGSNPSSRLSSPTGSRGSISCYAFYSHSFKNKDFDPFAAALEEIRKEDAWFEQATPPPPHGRSRSQSPLNSSGGHKHAEKQMVPAEPAWQVERILERPTEDGKDDSVGPTEATWRLTPIGPPETNMECQMGPKKFSDFPEPGDDAGGPTLRIVRRWRSFVRWSKIKRTGRDGQIQSESNRRFYARDKLRDHQMATIKDIYEPKSPSFREIDQTHYNVKEGVEHGGAEMRTLTRYKPNNMLLCFGFSSRG